VDEIVDKLAERIGPDRIVDRLRRIGSVSPSSHRSGSVGRPFTKGNPGGGRPKGAQNKATLEIKEFARNFLMSDRYQRTLERRILAGTAPHMEVLLHHYAFGIVSLGFPKISVVCCPRFQGTSEYVSPS
jgi:hypothetical protein